jgi:hypothetical protein
MGDVTAGALQARVRVIDPDSRSRALHRIFRHERHLRIFFFQILVDDRRLIDYRSAVHQHWDFAIGVEFQQFLRFVFEIALDEVVRNPLFR